MCACVETYWQIDGLTAAQANLIDQQPLQYALLYFNFYKQRARSTRTLLIFPLQIEINQSNKSFGDGVRLRKKGGAQITTDLVSESHRACATCMV